MTEVDRDKGGNWVKGTRSPNPGGRKKDPYQVREIARQMTPKAMEVLFELMTNDTGTVPPGVRVTAAKEIIDRGYGKPVQETVISGARDYESMSKDELADFIRRRIKDLGLSDASLPIAGGDGTSRKQLN
jgi:hypothetical protein